MTFEGINKMDTMPFDYNVLGNVYFNENYYSYSAVMPWLHSLLMFQYFKKFDETYGTRLTRYNSVPSIVWNVESSIDEEEMDPEIWEEETRCLMTEAFTESGWNIEWIFLQDVNLENCRGGAGSDDQRKEFHEDYEEYIMSEFNDCLVRTAILNEEETMYDAKCYLEEGEMGIFWNEQLSNYLAFRKERKDVVDAACPKEDAVIMELEEEDAWAPFMVFREEQKKQLENGWEYGVVTLGCDGYSWTDISSINPNWICVAMKMKFMLDLASEKIKRYLEQEKQMDAA